MNIFQPLEEYVYYLFKCHTETLYIHIEYKLIRNTLTSFKNWVECLYKTSKHNCLVNFYLISTKVTQTKDRRVLGIPREFLTYNMRW